MKVWTTGFKGNWWLCNRMKIWESLRWNVSITRWNLGGLQRTFRWLLILFLSLPPCLRCISYILIKNFIQNILLCCFIGEYIFETLGFRDLRFSLNLFCYRRLWSWLSWYFFLFFVLFVKIFFFKESFFSRRLIIFIPLITNLWVIV